MEKWSFNYRGNGYGYFNSKNECVEKAKEKISNDNSCFVEQYGSCTAFIFKGARNEAIVTDEITIDDILRDLLNPTPLNH